MIRCKIYSVPLVIIIFLIIFSSCSFAGISVTPSMVEITINKGEEKKQMFIVSNTGGSPINVRVGRDKLRREDLSANNWLFFQVEEFEIKPGEYINIPYIVKIPKDSQGEWRCWIVFNANEIGENRNPVGMRLKIPLYVVVQNTVKLSAEINDLKVIYNNTEKMLSGTILVNNKSNVHIRPHVNFSIKNLYASEKHGYTVPYGQGVQRDETKPFFFKQQNLELLPGKYRVTVNLDYGKMYGQKDMIATKETEFEIKPLESEPEEANTALSEGEIEDDAGL